jgi:hypothetical protein
MITDISLVNSKVQITEGANHPHVYSVSDDHDYYFDADSVLRLIIRSTTYTIAFADLTIGGSAPANIGAAYTSLASVFPNANSGSGGSGSYKVYSALLNQSGTSAPVATVFDNSVPGVWTRDQLGVSKFTFTTPIATNKFFMPGSTGWLGANTINIQLTNEHLIRGNLVIYVNNPDGPENAIIDAIFIDSFNGDFSSLVEFGTLVTDFPFEFRVYA